MSDNKIVPVILCGGSGTRLWPRSRVSRPKPFLPLIGDMTLFEATLARCDDRSAFGAPVVVTGVDHLRLVESQLGQKEDTQIIVEPSAQNTAAAIALAAMRLPGDAVMLVCPSDHYISNTPAFRAGARAAAALASEDWLVSLGIEAKSPETGFGYLRRGEAIGPLGYRTAQFIEKPALERAQAFVESGDYVWNGGIFAFKVDTFLKELEAHRPAILTAVRAAVASGRVEGHLFYPDAAAFSQVENESVDYAVMEKTDRAALVPTDMGWSDIGNWDALHTALACDQDGNVARGSVELVQCRNVLADTSGPRISAIGLENIVIVVDGDEVLVTSQDSVQLVGKLYGAQNQ